MSYKVEKISENKIKITVTIPAGDVEEACKEAAMHLGEELKIPGFRPGKASYDIVKQRVGEMAILEHAAEDLVRSTFVDAMIAEDLETVGQPFFSMGKLAPGNDMEYSAEISLMPEVTKMADIEGLSVTRNDVKPTDRLIEDAKNDLLRMQTREVRAESGHALVKGDKGVVNLTMKKEGVVLEGGESTNHGVYTHEPHYIEGFVNEIIGMKEGDERSFVLKFPKDHYQKHIAGHDIDFTVKVNEIFVLQHPAFDDEFAKSLGVSSVDEVMAKLHENLLNENVTEEERRLDKAVLDLIAEKSTFDAIPDLLINQEVEKMTHELQHQIETQGMEFATYLTQIGKSQTDLKLDFAPQAMMRIKVGIVLREIQKKGDMKVDAALVDTELDKIAAQFKETDESRKRVYEPQYREYVERQLLNRQTIDMLKGKIVK